MRKLCVDPDGMHIAKEDGEEVDELMILDNA